jgi:ribosomal-protein-alanine N-acetyltransferase
VDLTGVIFREMDGEEVEEVIDLEYEVLGSSAFVRLSTLPYYKKVIVADAGELAGCAVVYWDSETFRLGSIAVKEKYRRMGIGTELIKKCAEIAEKLGFDSIWLEVSVSNRAAIEVYEKSGFVIHETLKHFYGIGRHAYLMVYYV